MVLLQVGQITWPSCSSEARSLSYLVIDSKEFITFLHLAIERKSVSPSFREQTIYEKLIGDISVKQTVFTPIKLHLFRYGSSELLLLLFIKPPTAGHHQLKGLKTFLRRFFYIQITI